MGQALLDMSGSLVTPGDSLNLLASHASSASSLPSPQSSSPSQTHNFTMQFPLPRQ